MTLRIQRWDQHQHMEWANGGGSTAQIARSSSGPDGTDFDWRLSVADVIGDGAFSSLPGVDRTIINLGAVEMTLTVDGVPHELEQLVPFDFDGGAQTSCRVSGPTRDLNVMTRRGRAEATVEVRPVTEGTTVSGAFGASGGLGSSGASGGPAADDWLVVLDGALEVGDERLGIGDAVHLAAGQTTALTTDGGEAMVAVVSFRTTPDEAATLPETLGHG